MYSWQERQAITEAYRRMYEDANDSQPDNYKDTYKGISDGAQGIIDNYSGFGDSMSTKEGQDAFWNTLKDETGRRFGAVGKGIARAGKEVITHPVDTAKQFGNAMWNAISHPIDTVNALKTNPEAVIPFSGLFSEEGAENYNGSQLVGDAMAIAGAKGIQKGMSKLGNTIKNARGVRAAKNIGRLEKSAEKAAQLQSNAQKQLGAISKQGHKLIHGTPGEQTAFYNGANGNAFNGLTFTDGANGRMVMTPEFNAYNSGRNFTNANKIYKKAAAKSAAAEELVNNARNAAWDKGFVAPGESGVEASERLLSQASNDAMKSQAFVYGGNTANTIASELKKQNN